MRTGQLERHDVEYRAVPVAAIGFALRISSAIVIAAVAVKPLRLHQMVSELQWLIGRRNYMLD